MLSEALFELLKPHEGKKGFVLPDEGGILVTQERLNIFARNVNAHINLHGAGMRELRNHRSIFNQKLIFKFFKDMPIDLSNISPIACAI